jgi:Zn-dependent metalloprotease
MCHNPIFCITPPHILEEIIKRGESHHQEIAMNTLVHSERLRGQREIKQNRINNQAEFRIIESANYSQNLTGKVLRREGQNLTGDPAVDEAYAYIGDTWSFYKKIFNRNSIDGKGMQLFATVHYGSNFDNAFWNGQRMVFGDGDGQIFQRFTKCPEVIGHELTHGVTGTTANLGYYHQQGALNECLSDVFGSLV